MAVLVDEVQCVENVLVKHPNCIFEGHRLKFREIDLLLWNQISHVPIIIVYSFQIYILDIKCDFLHSLQMGSF
jgi:hypothetical protein